MIYLYDFFNRYENLSLFSRYDVDFWSMSQDSIVNSSLIGKSDDDVEVFISVGELFEAYDGFF